MKKVLYFFPENPLERNAGNKTRALQLLQYFRDRKLAADLMSTDLWLSPWNSEDVEAFRRSKLAGDIRLMEKKPEKNNLIDYFFNYKIHQIPYRKKFDKSQIGMHSHATWYSRSTFRELVRQNEYDYIIISYIYWAELIHDIRSFSKARTIIDTHDFMTSQCRQNKHFQLGPFFEEEISRLRIFDEIWTISVDEQYLFSRFCQGNVRWVPPMLDAPAVPLPANTAGRPYDLIYVASDNPHNLIAADWFFKEVHPRLPEQVRICVVGKISSHAADHPNVIKIPFAENIGEYYDQSKAAVCPILSGTGTKIKVVEAISHGLPVVCTTRGTDGLPDKINNGCLAADDPQDFARNISALLANTGFYQEQVNLAAAMFFSHFEKNRCYQELDEIFGV
ncbi:glycosyltransferase involved in cell wall biosynthesis [Anseongella ginsenosidimutans]|uniref:Glycosyltransferase involved in cell wall biosynthesis n=1 Tax=Anseongella ginsenosidimutans TaxID=496056 RepID=A0A4R3KMV8_9SPHI|nr:glycosyltransferase [Anseongella ginsenosidimutans]QEC51991.1 glycosyltransferase family 4 protein [Anseongella ginsenosidimutans]TCS85712.1 glycosyltransferase involved in cell wall biosynthesis [Anseongella ginsenosidimutans]